MSTFKRRVQLVRHRYASTLHLYFLGLFSGSSMILYKQVSGKKSFYRWKCMGTKDVYKPWKKRDLTLKTPSWLYLICRCKEEKSLLWKRLRLDLIFPRLRTNNVHSHGKKSSYSGKWIGTNNVHNHEKKGFDIKNTSGYI